MRITLIGQKSNDSLPSHRTPPPPRGGAAAGTGELGGAARPAGTACGSGRPGPAAPPSGSSLRAAAPETQPAWQRSVSGPQGGPVCCLVGSGPKSPWGDSMNEPPLFC